MLVSVIIPMYNAETTIQAALQSVKDQTFKNFEILITDDGSTDNSRKIVEDFIKANPQLKIQIFTQVNLGVSAARNVGLQHCSGDYIAFLDADDVWLRHKTERQLQVFKTHPQLDFLATRRNNSGFRWPYFAKKKVAEVNFRKLLIRNEITVPSVMMTAKIKHRQIYFPQKQRYAEDLFFYFKICEHFQMAILDESLVFTGNGKRSFGISGLSANLHEMHLGFLDNLRRLYIAGRISRFELIFYRQFYKLKYALLIFRTFIGL